MGYILLFQIIFCDTIIGKGIRGPYPFHFIICKDSLRILLNHRELKEGKDFALIGDKIFFKERIYPGDTVLVIYKGLDLGLRKEYFLFKPAGVKDTTCQSNGSEAGEIKICGSKSIGIGYDAGLKIYNNTSISLEGRYGNCIIRGNIDNISEGEKTFSPGDLSGGLQIISGRKCAEFRNNRVSLLFYNFTTGVEFSQIENVKIVRAKCGKQKYSLREKIIPGSEKIYLNSKKLIQGKDYEIDYDKGEFLIYPHIVLKDGDVIEIHYKGCRRNISFTLGYKENRLKFGDALYEYDFSKKFYFKNVKCKVNFMKRYDFEERSIFLCGNKFKFNLKSKRNEDLSSFVSEVATDNFVVKISRGISLFLTFPEFTFSLSQSSDMKGIAIKSGTNVIEACRTRHFKIFTLKRGESALSILLGKRLRYYLNLRNKFLHLYSYPQDSSQFSHLWCDFKLKKLRFNCEMNLSDLSPVEMNNRMMLDLGEEAIGYKFSYDDIYRKNYLFFRKKVFDGFSLEYDFGKIDLISEDLSLYDKMLRFFYDFTFNRYGCNFSAKIGELRGEEFNSGFYGISLDIFRDKMSFAFLFEYQENTNYWTLLDGYRDSKLYFGAFFNYEFLRNKREYKICFGFDYDKSLRPKVNFIMIEGFD